MVIGNQKSVLEPISIPRKPGGATPRIRKTACPTRTVLPTMLGWPLNARCQNSYESCNWIRSWRLVFLGSEYAAYDRLNTKDAKEFPRHQLRVSPHRLRRTAHAREH